MAMFNRVESGVLRDIAIAGLLWAGLLICGFAVFEHWREFSSVLAVIGARGAVIICVIFVIIWLLAVASWRQLVEASSSQIIPWSSAARHLSLLLLGKYIPGGVWGFLARLSASTTYGSMTAMASAGFVEQYIGLAMVGLVGGLALLAAYLNYIPLLLCAILFPFLVTFSLRFATRLMRWLSAFLPDRWSGVVVSATELSVGRQIFRAASLTLLQIFATLSLVAAVASVAFNVDSHTMLAVSGAYGLGVTVGIAAIFMPGGILVREAVFVILCRDWITAGEAVALAGGLRFLFTAFDLSAGLGSAFLHYWSARKCR